MVERICENCGGIFQGGSGAVKYCPKCKPLMKQRDKEIHKQNREFLNAQRTNRRHATQSLAKVNAILREIDAYNKRHGTHLSYGKYMALKYAGRLGEGNGGAK